MNSTSSILAAVDLGPDTGKVLSYALWLSQTLADGAADITLLNVMDYALTPPAYLLPYLEKEEAASSAEIGQWAGRLKQRGAAANARVAVGRLIETFSRTVRELPVAALVLGHKSHILRTSSSERLIKSLPVSMLVVRGPQTDSAALGTVSVKNILCPVDFSGHSKKALDFAHALSEKLSSTVTIAHVLSSIELDKSFSHLRGLTEEDKKNYMNYAVEEAERSICAFSNLCDGAERIVRIGVPYKTINEIAREKGMELIVIGAQGASSTKGVLLGSIAEAVIKSSACPVMLIR